MSQYTCLGNTELEITVMIKLMSEDSYNMVGISGLFREKGGMGFT